MSDLYDGRKCCQCTKEEHKCVNCRCARQNRKCINCRKGDGCQNPLGRDQGGEREEEEQENSQESQGESQHDRRQDEVRVPDTPPQPPQRNPPPPQPPQLDPNVVENERGIFTWKGLTAEAITRWVSNTYLEIVGWSAHNLFEPPKCAATTKIAKEMVILLNQYIQDTPFAPHALKIFFMLPKLFFQRTHNRTKTSENVKAVTRRVDLWLTNKLDELLEEARAIQKRPTRLPLNQKNENKARNFADRMRQGKVASALRALNEEETGGVLPLTRDTILQLKEKHPPPSEMVGLRLQGCHQAPNSVIYEMITGDMVWKKALQTHGSAVPSGLDARGWRRLLSSTLRDISDLDYEATVVESDISVDRREV
ncbi:hypothetical protein Pcinc_004980 [Petrolisthes cinctipes]|uniref:Uncharacterized protein n=1 Tax=Petrolisthes cinctipes TaxID=88211 RepID=A0AAE1KZK1_PETCI|nr:hypothetical protein Pcinc_004980 [Petrolisthes cinctipes]